METSTVNTIITVIGGLVAAMIGALVPYLLNKKKEDVETNNAVERKREKAVDMKFVIGILLVVASSIFFASHHVIARKLMIGENNPLLVLIIRNFIAATTMYLIASFLRHFDKESSPALSFKREGIIVTISRTLTGLFNISALCFISASTSITLFKLNPIFVFILLLFIIRTSIGKITLLNIIIGLIVAVGGAILIVKNPMQTSVDSNYSVGVIIAILAGLTWGIFAVFSEKHDSSIDKTKSWQRFHFLSKVYFYTSAIPLILVPFLFLKYNLVDLFQQLLPNLGTICVLGVISAIAGILYFESLKRISSLLVSVIVALEIFITLVIESIFISNTISTFSILGALLVVVGAISICRENEKIRLN